MVKVIVLCGKVGSGKTTYAKKLEADIGAVTLSVDEWMLGIHGRDIPCSNHQEMVERVKKCLYKEADKFLSKGVNVILDFGFWTRKERGAVKERFGSYDVLIHYLKADEELLYRRLEVRNSSAEDATYKIERETHERLNARFEEPVEEDVVTIEQL